MVLCFRTDLCIYIYLYIHIAVSGKMSSNLGKQVSTTKVDTSIDLFSLEIRWAPCHN